MFNALFGRLKGFRDKTKTVNRTEIWHYIAMCSFNNSCLPNICKAHSSLLLSEITGSSPVF